MITVKQFLDAGFDLVGDDVILNVIGESSSACLVGDSAVNGPFYSMNLKTAVGFIHPDYKIKSLAWRKNEGKQPVADGLPLIICDLDCGFTGEENSDWFNWSIEGLGGDIKQWKPNLEALELQMNDKQETVLATEMSERDVENFCDAPDNIRNEVSEGTLGESAVRKAYDDLHDLLNAVSPINPFDACASNEDGDVVEWKNGDVCDVEHSSHDEIVFIGLSGNKAVAVCECITEDRRVILDKFWVSDLKKPESPQEKAEREREENGRSLFELKVSLTSISCVHWDDQAESSKESWRQFAELVTLKDEHKE